MAEVDRGKAVRIKRRDGQVEEIAVSAAVEIVRAADYVRWYDALPMGDPDQLAVLDLAFPAFLDAVPTFKALLADNGWDKLEKALRRASDVLRRLPLHVPLYAWNDTLGHRQLLQELFVATTGGKNRSLPRFGPACCTKMLHKKRPALIPIIDSWQMEAHGVPTDPWSTAAMVGVVFEIRDFMADQVPDFLELGERLKAADPSLPHLTEIRLYDILFWELSRRADVGKQE